MKVELTSAPLAKITLHTKDGQKIEADDIEKIVIEPYFGSSSGPGELLRGRSLTNSGKEVDKFTLAAGGASGKVTRRENTEKSAVPSIDKPKQPKAAQQQGHKP